MKTFLPFLLLLLLPAAGHAQAAAVLVDKTTGNVTRDLRLGSGQELEAKAGAVVDFSAVAFSYGAATVTTLRPAQLTTATHDYAPTGIATAGIIYLTSDGPQNLTGLVPGPGHRLINIGDTSDDVITLVSESASSTAANRFTGGDLVLAIGGSVDIVYDTVAARWRASGAAAVDGVSLQFNAAGQLYVEPADIAAGTVMGRASGSGTGDPGAIDGTAVRVLAGLAVTDRPNFANVRPTQSVITYAASVALDFDSDGVQTIALTGDLTFAASTNLAAGVPKTIILTGDTVQRALAFPAGWKFIGPDEPITLDANKTAVLSLLSTSTTDSAVIAGYSVEP